MLLLEQGTPPDGGVPVYVVWVYSLILTFAEEHQFRNSATVALRSTASSLSSGLRGTPLRWRSTIAFAGSQVYR